MNNTFILEIDSHNVSFSSYLVTLLSDHVTLLGHNSGATLAMALMSSPLGKGLFHQVWVSGGSPLTGVISFQVNISFCHL